MKKFYFLVSLLALSFQIVLAQFNFAALDRSTPLTLTNKKNIVIQNLSFSSADGNDLSISSCTNIVIKNCYFGSSKLHGISLQTSSNITIQNCFFANNDQCIIAYQSSGVKVINNQFLNVHGSGANGVVGGNFIQFNQITGAGNEVSNNIIESVDGESIAEDMVSMYASSGTQSSPLYIRNNIIKGGGGESGKNTSGGTIQTGDGDGSWIVIDNNKIYYPFNFGVGISSGLNMTISNNTVVGRTGTSMNFAGIFWAKFYTTCDNLSIVNNNVQHSYGDGYQGQSACTNVNNAASNNWKATGITVPDKVLNIADVDYTRIRGESIPFLR